MSELYAKLSKYSGEAEDSRAAGKGAGEELGKVMVGKEGNDTLAREGEGMVERAGEETREVWGGGEMRRGFFQTMVHRQVCIGRPLFMESRGLCLFQNGGLIVLLRCLVKPCAKLQSEKRGISVMHNPKRILNLSQDEGQSLVTVVPGLWQQAGKKY